MGGPPEAAPLGGLEKRLGVVFPDRRLLLEALTHSSYANENGGGAYPSNERLEFLGDAVVSLAAADLLWEAFPGVPEGTLSQRKAVLVSQDTLARRARALGLHRFLLLGTGEERSGGRERPSLLADAFEAVVGAMYIAAGWETTRRFVQAQLREELDRRGGPSAAGGGWLDPKSRLQQVTQAMDGTVPVYELVAAEGPPHQPRFEVAVLWDGKEWGRGKGGSRREAEQEAARQALEKLPRSRRARN